VSRDFQEAFGRPDFPLDGVHLVAASAGTGKTWNIGSIFARLLMANGWRISQILVVTFTDAATRELRDRLRRLLQQLQDEFRRPGAGDAQAQLLAGLVEGEEARRRARRAVDEALLEFDQAAVSTIHAFCGRALKRYAFESGLPFDAEPPAAVRQAQLETMARDWWRRNVAPLPPGEGPGFTLAELFQTLKLFDRPGIRPAGDDATAGPKAALLRVAFELDARWNAERPERKKPDFDDVLLGMRDALLDESRREGFVRALREEYAAVLVDEFQDTDPVQYGIFREAFLSGGSEMPVFFIGDPKQSIYAFRGGDIYTYREAAAAVPEGRRYGLHENFRSAPGIVAAVNALFRDEGGESTFGDATIPCDEIRAGGGKRDIEGGAAVRFAEVPKGTVEAACADEIAALLRHPPMLRAEKNGDGRPLSPGDVAVLVRNGIERKGGEIAEQLRARGVRAVVLDKKNSVFGGPEFSAFRLLLAALANPTDAKTARASLLTPFFGLGAAAAAELARPDGALAAARMPSYPFLARRADPGAPAGMEDFLQLFLEWKECWRKNGFLAAFARLEEDLALRPRLAAGRRGERTLVNVLHLAELLHARASAVAATPAALLDWVERKAADEAGEEACLRLESDENEVQIMTLHSSKGLEFPVVFLPDAYTRGGGTQNKSPLWHVWHQPAEDGSGRFELVAGVGGEAEAEKERSEEEMRLLYVGITRAAWRCVVFAPEKDEDIKTPAFRKVLERAKAADGVECGPWIPPEADAGGGASAPGTEAPAGWLPVPPMPVLPPPRGSGSYSTLSPPVHGAAADPDAAQRPRDLDSGTDVPGTGGAPEAEDGAEEDAHPIFAFPGGTALGTCWHAIFEEADFRADGAALRALVEKKLRDAGLADAPGPRRAARTAAVLDMVERTLALSLEAPDGSVFRLRDVAPEDRASEWEFDFSSRNAADTTARLRDVLEAHWGGEPEGSDHRLFLAKLAGWDQPIPKGFLRGFIDLLFRHGGRYYVVDWKSNKLGGRAAAFSREGLRNEMADCMYFLQYLIYAAVVHRHLRDSLPGYSWEKHFGGVRYVFLRGAAVGREAVYADRPAEALLDDFGEALGLRRRVAT